MSWKYLKEAFSKKEFFKAMGVSAFIYSLIFIITSVFSDSIALLLVEILPLFFSAIMPIESRMFAYALVFLLLTVLSALVANSDEENYIKLYLIVFFGAYAALSVIILFTFVYGRASSFW